MMTSKELPSLEGYEFLAKLGSGSMGSVYRAREIATNTDVAIKTLLVQDESQRTALKNEWTVLQRVEHPYLIDEIAFFEVGSNLFMVMELFESKTLGQWIEVNSRADRLGQLFHFAGQLTDLLSYLHGQSPPVIVRDLKPDNILVNERNQIKLIDFGIARSLETDSKTHLNLKGFASQSYAPLEQYTAKATTSEKSDVYSLAATLYHLLMGSPPPSAIELLSGQLQVHSTLVKNGFSVELSELIAFGMQLKADERADLAAFKNRLQQLDTPETILGDGQEPQSSSTHSSEEFRAYRSTAREAKLDTTSIKQLIVMTLFLISLALVLDFSISLSGL
jgi:eukaryotic-like serine/threonine-protein kinase